MRPDNSLNRRSFIGGLSVACVSGNCAAATTAWVGLFSDISTANISPAITRIVTMGYSKFGVGAAEYVRADGADPNAFTSRSADGRSWIIDSYPLTFDMFGAVGDGITDDAPAINAASSVASNRGHRRIDGVSGRVYRIKSSLRPRQRLLWDFHNSSLVCGEAIAVFDDNSNNTKVFIAEVVEDILGPTDILILDRPPQVSVGDWIAVRLGDNPWDAAEPRYAFASQVRDVQGSKLRIDWAVPHSISTRSAQKHNRSVYLLKNDHPVDVTFKDLEIRGDELAPGLEGGFFLRWGVRIGFENVIGNPSGRGDMGCGIFGLIQFSRHIRIIDGRLSSNKNTRRQASFGRMFNFSNCIDVHVERPEAKNLEGAVAVVESYCENVRIVSPRIHVTKAIARPRAVIWFAGQGSELEISDAEVTTDFRITSFVDTGGTPATIQISRNLTWNGPFPLDLFSNPEWVRAALSLSVQNRLYRVDYRRRFEFVLHAEMGGSSISLIKLPTPITSLFVELPPHIDPMGMERATLLLGARGGRSLSAALGPGHTTDIGRKLGLGQGANWGGLEKLIGPAYLRLAEKPGQSHHGGTIIVRGEAANFGNRK